MKNYKTIILGAGLIGSSIAFHLSKKETGILVVDQGYPSSGTSGSNQSWIWVHTKKPDYYAEFSMYSAELYPSLKKELSMDFEYRRTGGISPIFTKEEWEQAERMVEEQRARGINIKLLTKKQALKKEPALNPDILGATYSSLDGHVNPMRLNTSLYLSAQKNGVSFSFYNKVLHVERENNGNFIVTTQNKVYYAEKVVIAGGKWTSEMANWFDARVPIEKVKGQIIVTEPIPPLLKHIVRGMRQTNNGEILIGMSSEYEDNRTTTFDVMKQSASLAVKLIPKLNNVRIVRHFSGVRGVPIDKLPVLGEIPDNRGLFVAATHSGVTLTPIVGYILSEIIMREKPSISIAPYDVKRFYYKDVIK
jgi:glycine/D-amino acid oxidase-like deaminating enzyme